MQTFEAFLASLKTAETDREKSNRFEDSVQRWWRMEPAFREETVNLWKWRDFADYAGFNDLTGVARQDLNIQLVAEMSPALPLDLDANSNAINPDKGASEDEPNREFWAVKCKCYAHDHAITKSEIDSLLNHREIFVVEGRRYRFSHFVWVAVGGKWAKDVREYADKLKNLTVIQAAHLAKFDCWDEEVPLPLPKAMSDYEQNAVASGQRYFSLPDEQGEIPTSGKLMLSIGVDKTLLTLRLMEELLTQQTEGESSKRTTGVVLCCVKSVEQMNELAFAWKAEARLNTNDALHGALRVLGVYADNNNEKDVKSKPQKVKKLVKGTNAAGEDSAARSFAGPVLRTTKQAQTLFLSLLRTYKEQSEQTFNGLTVVLATYESLGIVHDAQQLLFMSTMFEDDGPQGEFDLVVTLDLPPASATKIKPQVKKPEKQKNKKHTKPQSQLSRKLTFEEDLLERGLTITTCVQNEDYLQAKRRLYVSVSQKKIDYEAGELPPPAQMKSLDA